MSLVLALSRVASAEEPSAQVAPRTPPVVVDTIVASSAPSTARALYDWLLTREHAVLAALTGEVRELSRSGRSLASREDSLFEERLARFVRASELSHLREAQEEAAFDARTERFAREIEFSRKQEAAEIERETVTFQEELGRSLKVHSFMKKLQDQRAAERIEVPNTLAPEPEEWLPPPSR
jgi:hypothetical protein